MDEELDRKTLAQIWQESYTEVKDIRGVPVQLRTLYDNEELDCLIKSAINTNPTVQQFTLARWQLAYSVTAVGGMPFEGAIETKYKEILEWPNVIVRLCYEAFTTIFMTEDGLVRNLGEFGDVEKMMNTDSDSASTGLSPKLSDLEIGQLETADSVSI